MEDTDNLKIESYQQQFKEKGYAVIEGFVPPGVAALIANYARTVSYTHLRAHET